MHGIMWIGLQHVVLSARTTPRSSCKYRLEVPTNLQQRFTGVVSVANNGMISNVVLLVVVTVVLWWY